MRRCACAPAHAVRTIAARSSAGLVGRRLADVIPRQRVAGGDVAGQVELVGQPDRDASLAHRRGRGLTASPDAIAALAVEPFAGPKVALGDRDHVGAERARAPVGSSRSTTDKTLTASSSPMKWFGRYSEAYSPRESSAAPYSARQRRV